MLCILLLVLGFCSFPSLRPKGVQLPNETLTCLGGRGVCHIEAHLHTFCLSYLTNCTPHPQPRTAPHRNCTTPQPPLHDGPRRRETTTTTRAKPDLATIFVIFGSILERQLDPDFDRDPASSISAAGGRAPCPSPPHHLQPPPPPLTPPLVLLDNKRPRRLS